MSNINSVSGSQSPLYNYLKFAFDYTNTESTTGEQIIRGALLPANIILTAGVIALNTPPSLCGCSGCDFPRVHLGDEPDVGSIRIIEQGDFCASDSDCRPSQEELICSGGVCLPINCQDLRRPIEISCGPAEELGICKKGTQELSCNNDGGYTTNECIGAVDPRDREYCNNLDDNCDGTTDEFYNSDRNDCPSGEKRYQKCEHGVWSDWSECKTILCKPGETDIAACHTGLPGNCDPGIMIGTCQVEDGAAEGHFVYRDNDKCFSIVDPALCQSTDGGIQDAAIVRDAGRDAGLTDSSVRPDGAINLDATVSRDANIFLDASTPGDAGITDANVRLDGTIKLDAAIPDNFNSDSNIPDGHIPDTYIPDSYIYQDAGCPEEQTITSYSGPAGTENIGICKPDIRVCENGTFVITQAQILPQAEICDGLDNDCNGKEDEARKMDENIVILNQTGGNTWTPSIAWNGQEYGIATDVRSGLLGSGIYFSVINNMGSKMFPDRDLLNSWGGSPSLIWGNNEFALSYVDVEYQIFFSQINSGGEIISGPLQITENRVGTDGSWSYSGTQIIWTGSRYAVVYTDLKAGNPEVFLRQVDTSGNLYGNEIQVTNNTAYSISPSLSWYNNKYYVSWCDSRDGWGLYLKILDSEGNSLTNDLIVSDVSYNRNWFWPTIVSADNELGILWHEQISGNNNKLILTRVDLNGNIIAETNLINESNLNPWISPFSLIYNGNEYAVRWVDSASYPPNQNIYFSHFSNLGQKIGENVYLGNIHEGGNGSLAWNGEEYGITWDEFINGPTGKINFARVGNICH